jgi:hypothetical protein
MLFFGLNHPVHETEVRPNVRYWPNADMSVSDPKEKMQLVAFKQIMGIFHWMNQRSAFVFHKNTSKLAGWDSLTFFPTVECLHVIHKMCHFVPRQ